MLKGVMVAFFGGTPEEKPDQYAASSPITYVENVSAPVLIIQGRNHYPQDIEATVEAASTGVRTGSVAAFGIDVDGEERLVAFDLRS